MAYKSLDLQTHVFQQKVPYQITILQGYFLSLLDTYIHGEKDLPYYIFPISFIERGISNIRAWVVIGTFLVHCCYYLPLSIKVILYYLHSALAWQ